MRLPRFIAPSALRATEWFIGKFGFTLVDTKPPNPGIKDACAYAPFFAPWLLPEWQTRLRADDSHSLLPLQARYMLYSLARDAMSRCDGSVAECGVYKGGTAKILAELAPDRMLHLFDTFEGMPETDPNRDLHTAGDFSDTSLASVSEYLSMHANAHLIAGLIPASLETVRNERFAFVHIDLDIYSAIHAACEFFYPRMQPGGIMLFDDYGYSSCPGARAAVDEFFAQRTEKPISLGPGQACVIPHHCTP